MTKRSRPHRVDLLPPEADEIRAWAVDAVTSKRLTQLEILAALNAKLKALKIKTVSHSAFGRWVLAGLEDGFAPRVPVQPDPTRCPTCGARVGKNKKFFFFGGRA